MPPPDRTYRARDFAALAGVTVRALHHYDRIGLLSPRRTAAGYRVYSARDLETLEQIVVLKFIGIPLRQINVWRHGAAARRVQALTAQRGTLERKRKLLDQAIDAIRELEDLVAGGHDVAPAVYKRVIEVMIMQNDTETWTQHYDELVKLKIDRLRSMSPDDRTQLRAQWDALVGDIRSALDDAPTSERARGFAERWTNLLAALMGQPVTPADLSAHQGAREWQPQMASFVDKPVWDFMARVFRALPQP